MSIDRYDFDVKENSRIGSPAYISISRFEKDWPSYIHSHDLTELFYVIQGEGEILVDNKTFQVSSNNLLLIQPNTLHREISSGVNPLEYLVLGLRDIKFIPQTPHGSSLETCTLFNFARQQRVVTMYYELIKHELKHFDEHSALMLHNLSDILLVHLARTFSLQFEHSFDKPRRHESVKAKTYIDKFFKTPLSLDQLAHEAHTSKFYLVRNFTKEYGKTPMQYLTEKRVQEAETLLKNSDMTISSISETVGYMTPAHFTHVFKKTRGLSPRQWRRNETKNTKG